MVTILNMNKLWLKHIPLISWGQWGFLTKVNLYAAKIQLFFGRYAGLGQHILTHFERKCRLKTWPHWSIVVKYNSFWRNILFESDHCEENVWIWPILKEHFVQIWITFNYWHVISGKYTMIMTQGSCSFSRMKFKDFQMTFGGIWSQK